MHLKKFIINIIILCALVLAVYLIISNQNKNISIKDGKNIIADKYIEIDSPIIIDKSNVELIGLPSTIVNNNNKGAPAIIVEGKATNVETKVIEIIDNTTLKLQDSIGFSTGDNIIIYNKILNDKLKVDFDKSAEEVYANELFSIIDIKENIITIDNPITESIIKKNNLSIFKISLIENISLKDIKIINSNNNGNGIEIRYAKNVGIYDITLENNTNGITLENVYDYRIQNNQILKNLNRGISIIKSNLGSIYKNTISKNGNDGIWLESSGQVSISNNIIDNNGHAGGGDGINLNKALDNIVYNNTISNGGCYGIWIINNSENNKIMDNIISNGVTYGIALSNKSSHNIILNNVVKENVGGVHILMAKNNYVINNSVIKNKYGIAVDDIIDNKILNNISEENYVDGTLINFLIGNTIENNYNDN